MTSRGIRNNNPGNIRHGEKWQGIADDQPDLEFVTFKNAPYGIRALAKVLITYQEKYELHSVSLILNRYAPPSENDTQAYIDAVCEETGFYPHQNIDLHQDFYLLPLVKAIIRHENGAQPYTDSQLAKGLLLAGIEPGEKPLHKTRTIRGAQIASTGVGLTAVSEVVTQVQDQLAPIIPYAQTLKYVFLAAAIIGICITVYARLDDRRKGLR